MVSARALSDPMPVQDIYAQLLATEQRMNARRAELGADVHMANINFRARGVAFLPPPSAPFFNQPTPPPQSRGDGGGPSRSGGGGGPPSIGGGGGNRPTCQICSKISHVASCCFKRYDPAYLGAGNDGRYKERQLAAFTNRSANAAATNTRANNTNNISYGATPSYPIDPTWYTDTAATDHFTNDLAKLSVYEPYNGKDQLQTANGSGMRIKHIGHSIIPSSSHPLHLKNILHVPDITHNLLPVKKFTHDNNIFFEFHPWYFLVKD
jgi:histone deacetylase 1/2